MNAVMRPELAPLCLGLHITKCAGTSLMTTLRHTLSEEEYYFFSSYHESWLASRPLFGDIVSRDRLRIVFGHYCHESLLGVFADRPVFLFTGLREPLACAVSGYRQVNAVRAQAGRPPVSAAEFLDGHADPICSEILRCFPTVAAMPGPVWARARSALSLFDFIYSTESFAADAAVLFAVLDLPPLAVASDNVSGSRRWAKEFHAYVDAEAAAIPRRARECLAGDVHLWESAKPYLGQAWVRDRTALEAWAIDRDAFTARLPRGEEATRTFRDLERGYLVHEFDQLGRLGDLRRSLEAQVESSQGLLSRIAAYGA